MGRLDPLLTPQSIAVVGANDDPSTYGGRLWGYIARYFPGRCYAVNRRPGAVAEGSVTDLLELPEAPDSVVLATPSATVSGLLARAGGMGARSVIVLDRESLGNERDLRSIAAETGTLLLGPNCLGLINANAGVPLSSSISLERGLRPGPFAFVGQSGALMGVLHARAIDTGLGIGLYVSTGSQAQLRVEDFLLEFATLPDIHAVAVYLEDLDVPLFEAAAEALAASEKKLVVLKGGLTERGGAASVAHSRSLASNGETFRALAVRLGATVVGDVDELLAALAVSRTAGPRLNLATISGGLAVVGTDQAVSLGLPVADLSPTTRKTLREIDIPATNPLDLESVASTDRQKAEAIAALAADPAADTTVVVINDMPGLVTALDHLGPVVDAAPDRIVVCSASSRQEDPIMQRWVESGRWFVEGLTPTLRALAATYPRRPSDAITTPASPNQLEPDRVSHILSSLGIPVPEGREIRTVREAREAARQLGYPVVLKIARAGHRGKHGVRTGITDEAALDEAYLDLQDHVPLLVQLEAPPGLEFYVGTVADPRFGLLLFVGMGGERLEGARDVAVTRCPVDRDSIRRLLGTTAVGRWLENPVSRRLVDIDALVDIAHRAVTASLNASPPIGSLDLNPVIVHPSGATVVDAKITIAGSPRADPAFLEAE